jgi:hypothetical protein
MTTKIRDIIAAEQQLEGAEVELARFTSDPSQWSAFETVDRLGKRSLHITELHFERQDALKGRVEVARQQLIATKRAFLADVIDGGADRAAG